MKIERVSEHIWSLRIWVLIPIHVWIVREEDGLTLVDAGLSGMAGGIVGLVDRLQAGPLRRIVLTHGHSDHVGALAKILRDRPVPVYAHRAEMPYMEGELPYPRRKKAVRFVAKGVAQPLPEDAEGRLAPIGSLTPYWTPGHSPGHVVYYHERDGVLLAGDLFNSRKGRLRRPMFTPDMEQAVKSAAIVGELQPNRLEVCHGGPVLNPAAQLNGYRQAAVLSGK
ncbi:MBL fold metallo-hydrolase [Paenibacillus cymbidii]|uniref:MBL fold metallo-hydrolase n=1 Tax=Paenibacillus cymbidii TaxID=1639034 RepID=UPI0010812C3B|nr:MBL fold metallo-hydrolase [Paenibacillus cymbidii]